MAGTMDTAKGRMKEAAGAITDVGKMKDAAGKLIDTAKEGAEKVTEKVAHAVHSAKK